MASAYTIDEIVAEGLELGNNTGITGHATTFLKFLLDTVLRNSDWEFLLKSTTITPGADLSYVPAANMPADYRAMRQLHIDGAYEPLLQIPHERMMVARKNDIAAGVALSAGTPTVFSIDEGAGSSEIYLYPRPAKLYTLNIRYYRMPDVRAYAGSTKVEFSDAASLIMAVAHFAQQYDQNNMQQLLQAEAKSIADSFRISHRDKGRASVEQIPFDEATFRSGPRGDSSGDWWV